MHICYSNLNITYEKSNGNTDLLNYSYKYVINCSFEIYIYFKVIILELKNHEFLVFSSILCRYYILYIRVYYYTTIL